MLHMVSVYCNLQSIYLQLTCTVALWISANIQTPLAKPSLPGAVLHQKTPTFCFEAGYCRLYSKFYSCLGRHIEQSIRDEINSCRCVWSFNEIRLLSEQYSLKSQLCKQFGLQVLNVWPFPCFECQSLLFCFESISLLSVSERGHGC